jgi:osmotically inducible lipoprotein OsmB
MRTLILAGALALAALTGCSGLSDRDQRILGGAAVGGAIGGAVTGDVGGALIGAGIGGLLGAEVDRNRNDRRYEDARRKYDECRRYYSRRECDNRRY